jgi:hypothetical protein
MKNSEVSNCTKPATFGNAGLAAVFTCKGCQCTISTDYIMRTDGWCYMCDPNITLEELLSDKPISNEKKETKRA